jgi:hypothetical protein
MEEIIWMVSHLSLVYNDEMYTPSLFGFELLCISRSGALFLSGWILTRADRSNMGPGQISIGFL